MDVICINANIKLCCLYSFTFETCCSLESVVEATEWGVKLHYKLEAETFQEGRKFSRIWFGPDHMSKSQIAENVVSVDHNKKQICQQHTAYLKVLLLFKQLISDTKTVVCYRKTPLTSNLQ